MSPLQLVGLARRLELLARVLADRLEHPVARADLRVALAQRGSCRGATAGCRGRRRRSPRRPRSVQPPAKTARRAKRRCSSSVRRSYDHSIVARRVCWRGSASRSPLSRSSRWESLSSSCSGLKSAVRAAASSSASGSSSRRRQSSRTASLGAKAGSTARARVEEERLAVRLGERRHGVRLLAARRAGAPGS